MGLGMTASANILSARRRMTPGPAIATLLAAAIFLLLIPAAAADAAVSVATSTPAAGATVSGNVTWQAAATSPDGIKQVKFTINDKYAWYEGVAPYVYNGDGGTWNTKDFADGTYQLKTVATSKKGEVATNVINVNVRNATAPPPAPTPSVSVVTTSPVAGSTVSGAIRWTADASAPEGVKEVRFYGNNSLMYTDTAAPWSYGGDTATINTAAYPDGTYSLAVEATSKLGAVARHTISITVKNTVTVPPPPPPAPTASVSITAPSAGATVSGSVPFTAAATASDGVKSVTFSIDGNSTYVDTTAPYVYNGDGGTWNTTGVANGTHQLTAVATSLGGASSTQTITVNVQNAVTPPPPDPTPPPTGASAVALDHAHVQISWPQVSGATSARVLRGSTTLVTRPAAVGRYTDSMLWYGTTYSYTVQMLNSSGAVVATVGPLSATTKPLPPGGFPVAFAGQPIWTGAIPSSPAIHPRNAQFMSYFTSHLTNPNLTTRSYGVPVYEADINDTLFGPFACDYACDINKNGKVPIPGHAAPDPGTDLHMTVLSADGKTAWDYYKPQKDANGVWNKTRTAVIVNMAGNGIISKTLAGANAANMASLAGLIRPEELAQGHIDHAVLLGIPGIAGGAPACPATHNVGTTSDPNALPEGARLQLDPAVNVDALSIPTWQKTIAKAMQRYGAYVRDNSGSLAVYGETTSSTLGGRRYDGWVKAGLGFSTSSGSQGFSSAFPWSKMRVLDFKYGPDC